MSCASVYMIALHTYTHTHTYLHIHTHTHRQACMRTHLGIAGLGAALDRGVCLGVMRGVPPRDAVGVERSPPRDISRDDVSSSSEAA